MIKRVISAFNQFLKKPSNLVLISALLLVVFSAQSKSSSAEAEVYEYPPLRVAVAQWRHEGGNPQNVQQSTYDSLVSELDDLQLENVIVEQIPVALRNANDVDRVASDFQVDVIVWGWYDEIAVRGFVDLANATQEDGLTNSLDAFLKNGGSTESIRVLKVLSEFDYIEDGVYFCVPRWTP